MRLIQHIKHKLNSIRRRILVAVSLVYLLSSAVSAGWIYIEVSHEVDELFDAEMLQQAKTLSALISVNSNFPKSGVVVQSLGAHGYEDKLSYRIESADGKVLMKTEGAPDSDEFAFIPGFSAQQFENDLWHAFGLKNVESGQRVLMLQEDGFRSELRMDLTIDTVIPVLFILPFMLWLGWWTINQNFSSFNRLGEELRRKRADDYTAFVEDNDREEVALVKRSLNHYLNRIEQTFLREKRFSADAAHELRTPLASLKAQLQSRLGSATAGQKNELQPLLDSTERLVKLVESLLQLSKAELPPERLQPVNVARLVRQALADQYAAAESKKLNYSVLLPTVLTHTSDENYLYLLFANALDNAIKYAVPGSSIHIEATEHEVSICNRVAEDHTIDIDRITERFYRGKQLGVEGSGLGLSIVKNLADQLGVYIGFRNTGDEFCFIVTFDPAQ
ncbi:histidine kinase dimerization/phospho-acceptor domain-containing protein [Idiomarina sp. HP20-50]|uniref:histidine kinase dimerization/phospho-acceptor domain-containing protein n=1 Tax=Idiomarina sp. HP20-50 TaxID=3070813 RepID=UPI00294B9363|nr:histidine kinase dimerization/phospho-acceptor domain-containing protein [Idiomarina sp. HP20-50]MDV6316422.1 histidine kinase dimerization/phospho-acceptor domain-containing protein [Idiomarina sp. HP20-50]